MVTMPEVPPYSSTTMAICTFFCWNWRNRSRQRVLSGTYKAGRISARMVRGLPLPLPMSIKRSLAYKTPTTLSSVSSYTGMREKPSSIAIFNASSISSSTGTASISVRWVITSSAVRSSNSKTL